MSVFSSTVKSGNTLNLAQLVQELQGELPGRPFSSQIDSVTNMNSTTYAARDTISVTTEADDVALVITTMSVSVNTANDGVSAYHEVDGVAQNNYGFYYAATPLGTSGDKGMITLIDMITDKAGTYNLKVMWNKTAGSVGPVYSRTVNTQVIVFKKRTS